jgi:LacI family transcriptional regulator
MKPAKLAPKPASRGRPVGSRNRSSSGDGESNVKAKVRARKTAGAPVRLEDVARYAGVSTASVSRAVNSPHLVSEELRDKVSRASQILNWVPNGAAKALASLRSRTIGVFIPTLGHQNFATLVETLQTELAKANYTVTVVCAQGPDDLRFQQVKRIVERGIECLILVGEAHPQSMYELLRAQNVPYVITYTVARTPGKVSIGFDNYAASSRATQHLLDLGHRRFALIAPPSEGNDRIQQRIAGIHETLARLGLAIPPQHVAQVESSRSIASGRAGLRQIWVDPQRPTALLCANDYIATGAMIEAKARGVSIPRDLSVVGFDDVDLSAHLDPPLTTIRVPVQAMGEAIARYVVRLLETGTAGMPAALDADLVVRASTGPPRKT